MMTEIFEVTEEPETLAMKVCAVVLANVLPIDPKLNVHVPSVALTAAVPSNGEEGMPSRISTVCPGPYPVTLPESMGEPLWSYVHEPTAPAWGLLSLIVILVGVAMFACF